eukprot:XP_017447810.1 PREDICTED: odorant-binding protein 2a-like [Rattus norvegicus]
MKSRLLTVLLLGLMAVLKAQEAPPDDQDDFSGKWYTKATVSDRNLTVGNNPKRTLPMMVSNMDGGDLYVKIKIWVTGYCYNIEVHLRKTNEPLKYTACECPADQGLLQGRVPAWRLPALLISHFGFPLPFHVGDIRVHG